MCEQVPGDTCDLPFTVELSAATSNDGSGSAWTLTGSTTGLSNDFSGTSTCGGFAFGDVGAGSSDFVYEFTAAEAGTFTFQSSGFDIAMYAHATCGSADSLAGSDKAFDTGTEEFELDLAAGVPVYIIIDGWDNSGNVSGSFTLEVSKADGPVEPTAGETCANAIALSLPLDGPVSGSTLDLTDDYSGSSSACTGYQHTGNDIAYSVELLG